jgi:serine/threonine protein kinase
MLKKKQHVGKAASGLMKIVGSAAQWAADAISAEEYVIGSYRVHKVKEMAEGGFSKVFLVRDAATRQPMAMKQMLCQEKESKEAAHREVEVSATEHPSILFRKLFCC